MATATMATAAGAAALLYYTLNRKLLTNTDSEDKDERGSELNNAHLGFDRISNRLIQAPATWMETISTLSETLRFTYSETLGKWPIGDLAFGINFLLKRQGHLHVASVFGGEDSVQLKGNEIISELKCFLNFLTLCWHFSKKPFPVFLEMTGYSRENVVLEEPKAGILKPAFTILVDHKTKSILLLIRGTHSIKDTLTAATGAVVPFHHSVVHEGGVSSVVLGYAHCGMVAAARWIAKLATPLLIKALDQYPNYKFKIVGHSLGGGTAALLTYILREQNELSMATCLTFAPAACMTWELAESGKEFITSVINGADLVPTFSVASVDDLRAEVTASAWINDLRSQIEHTRILSTVYRSASALGSRLPSMANARAKVAGAGAILRPVSNRTQVVMRRAQTMAQAALLSRPSLNISSWSCMGPRRRAAAVTRSNSERMDISSEPETAAEPDSSSPFIVHSHNTGTIVESLDVPVSSTREEAIWQSGIEYSVVEEEETVSQTVSDSIGSNRDEERMTEVELWQQLEQELYKHGEEEDDEEEEDHEVTHVKEIREEEEAAIAEVAEEVGQAAIISVPETKEVHRFFPPGRIMHIVTICLGSDLESGNKEGDDDDEDDEDEEPRESKVGIFLTERELYSKLRLSKTMIADHFMPVYRRQIEKLIDDLEKDLKLVTVDSNNNIRKEEGEEHLEEENKKV
ncbi:uncharacterized protein LOC124936451 [Impatiens glandulifera]|uniref:uncharacterized protein LOC124936451 n=1 Tax=Impatiens glandulifera TaxID=253017 RepID=UPI001FB07D20|nr:uncharacterized protein LOC124936451 [Impatiens glandulifera]